MGWSGGKGCKALYVGLSALGHFPRTNLGLRPRLVYSALSALWLSGVSGIFSAPELA